MRAIWKGAVSFGLVSVPVKLYAATESHDVSFRQVHAKDGGRIKYQRVCSIDGEEIAYADIAKGYETEDGEMVILTDEDMERAALDVLARDRGREVRAHRADRPDAVREVLLPRAGEVRHQALRPAPPGAARRRPDGRGDGRAAPAHHDRGAAGQGRRDRAPDDDVARRGPHPRLLGRDRRGQGRRGQDGAHAGRDPGRRLRPERVRGRLRRGRRDPGQDQDRGRRDQAHPDLDQDLRRGGRPARRAAALGRRRQEGSRRDRLGDLRRPRGRGGRGREAGQEDHGEEDHRQEGAERQEDDDQEGRREEDGRQEDHRQEDHHRKAAARKAS